MIAEVTVVPVGAGHDIAGAVARVVELVADSGLDYQVTAMGTIVEGEADAVWDLARLCHERAREEHDRVLTDIRIDDSKGQTGELHSDLERVEEILGRKIARQA